MKRPKFNTTDPDILRSWPALLRAAKSARELAIATGTPFWVMIDGKIVNLNKGARPRKMICLPFGAGFSAAVRPDAQLTLERHNRLAAAADRKEAAQRAAEKKKRAGKIVSRAKTAARPAKRKSALRRRESK